MSKKIIVITGASKGIGRATAEKFIANGDHVIAIARNKKSLVALDDYALSLGNAITIVPLDLQNFNKIDELGQALFNKFGKIDMLIANAAIIGDVSPIPHITPNVWQRVLDVNLTANYRLLRSFDLLLHKSEFPEVIFVCDNTAVHAPFLAAYTASKVGLETLANSYKAENSKIKVKVIYPQGTKTALRKKISELLPEDALEPATAADMIFDCVG